eukprot:GILK01007832.1.p1 GENE.GILK01007832.1~~GILK01007832.1.p1  ORF type:complete len:375 (-),score=76.86 GILK01007832.1:242-1366(-)
MLSHDSLRSQLDRHRRTYASAKEPVRNAYEPVKQFPAHCDRSAASTQSSSKSAVPISSVEYPSVSAHVVKHQQQNGYHESSEKSYSRPSRVRSGPSTPMDADVLSHMNSFVHYSKKFILQALEYGVSIHHNGNVNGNGNGASIGGHVYAHAHTDRMVPHYIEPLLQSRMIREASTVNFCPMMDVIVDALRRCRFAALNIKHSLVLALIYVHKLLRYAPQILQQQQSQTGGGSGVSFQSHTYHRHLHTLVLSCFLLAHKFLEDEDVANHSWVKQLKGLVTLQELNRMEAHILHYIDYRLGVSPVVFDWWLARLLQVEHKPSSSSSTSTSAYVSSSSTSSSSTSSSLSHPRPAAVIKDESLLHTAARGASNRAVAP